MINKKNWNSNWKNSLEFRNMQEKLETIFGPVVPNFCSRKTIRQQPLYYEEN